MVIILCLLTLLHLFQGHKRASSDVSVASSEDEKIPLSPSILESVPEKAEPALPVPAAPETPETPESPDTSEPRTPISTSFAEEPVTPVAEEPAEETPITPVEEELVEQRTAEQEVPAAGEEVSSPEAEVPDKEMQQLEITGEDEKEDDTAELPADTPTSAEGSEVTGTTAAVEESNTPEEKEEDPYKHLKVTVTLPEETKEENREKPTDKDHIVSVGDQQVPDKAKDEKERDSDSGRGSASDSNSVDLNLSISSFLSKAKEPGSVSVQVTNLVSK